MNFNDLIRWKSYLNARDCNLTYKDFLFLSSPVTIPCMDRDFYEWHNGILSYGFWAVVVNNPKWVGLYEEARAHIKQFVHTGYRRSPHITIAACGLLDKNYFSSEKFNRQWKMLNDIKIPPFYLRTGLLQSFLTAPYLAIEDSSETLKQIHERLMVISEEDASVQYQPHITLGFYRDAFDVSEVIDCLAKFKYASIKPLLVTELIFCAYKTREIQGQFKIVKRLPLNRPGINIREILFKK